MATVSEFSCGCVIHEIAGSIRKCSGTTSRSLSGRKVASGDEARHNNAMSGKAVRVYTVANILP